MDANSWYMLYSAQTANSSHLLQCSVYHSKFITLAATHCGLHQTTHILYKNWDPLFKIMPCWKAFFIAAQENMNPSEAVAIDECIIPLKVTKKLCNNK